MTRTVVETPSSPGSGGATLTQAVTVIVGIVVGLTFMFGFGNVLNLALRLDVPAWVAPLVAPAVDLSILGLLLGIRQLALAGATPAQLRPARRLLIFASAVTLALNVADPLVAGQYGKAAFDAVGPLLLIGWAEVGPDLLSELTIIRLAHEVTPEDPKRVEAQQTKPSSSSGSGTRPDGAPADRRTNRPTPNIDDDLLERARADAHHWVAHRRPISADVLRRKLRISATRSRLLVAMVRTTPRPHPAQIG